ncbi:hypothetical protein PR001_g30377 [Phytophthora rubi]|uniref:RxLR effector protein n=1 Tax=Phytophthora rubi TaxID=129364 RepID=A0A6A3GU74_9STRA|nr:hypothetical protein PR002_g30221 [Phytophthora rubi]KAE8960473.1 hypothetical protein PR001_g30377 [Phytophthora rubi]
MRFAHIVLVSAVALVAGSSGLATAEVNHNEISQVTSPEAVRLVAAEQNDDAGKRYLRSDKTDEKDDKDDDEEEKGLFDYMLDNAIARRTYRRWYRAEMNPKEVKSMLKKREAEGEYVDWALANGYAKYYRRRSHSLFYW